MLVRVQKLAIIIQSLNEWVSKSKIEQIRPQTTLNQIGVVCLCSSKLIKMKTHEWKV